VGSGQTGLAATRSGADGVFTPPVRRALVFFVIALLTLPIFAHGCHTGDHDDEPAFVPSARTQEPPP
jgi:hypothetical protein